MFNIKGNRLIAVVQYANGVVDLGGSKTKGPAPAADTHYFFSAFPRRGEQHRAEVQAIYDEGIRIALTYLGE